MHKLQLDGWSAWFVRPTLEQTCSFQCEKKKKKNTELRKQVSEFEWLSAKRLGHLGSDQTALPLLEERDPPLWRSRSVKGICDLTQRYSDTAGSCCWRFLLKCLNKPIPASREAEVTTQWAIEGERAAELALPVSCRHLYVSCIQKKPLPVLFSLCSCTEILIFFFFFVNNLSTFAKCSLLWCFCTSPPGSQLPITRHREVPDRLC